MEDTSPEDQKNHKSSAVDDPVSMRLLDAAEALLLEQGLGRSSMEAIAKRARASKRTLYARFPSKAMLIAAVADRLYARLRTDLAGLAASSPLPDFLRQFGRSVLTALREPRMMAFLRLVLSEAMIDPDFARAVLEAGKLPATQILTDRLEHARAAGEISAHTDPVLAARQFMGLVKEPTFWPQMLGAEALETDRSVDQAVSMFLKAYAA